MLLFPDDVFELFAGLSAVDETRENCLAAASVLFFFISDFRSFEHAYFFDFCSFYFKPGSG